MNTTTRTTRTTKGAIATAAAVAIAAGAAVALLTGCGGPSSSTPAHHPHQAAKSSQKTAEGAAWNHNRAPGLPTLKQGQTVKVPADTTAAENDPNSATPDWRPIFLTLDSVKPVDSIHYSAAETGDTAVTEHPDPGTRYVLLTWTVHNPQPVPMAADQTVYIDASFRDAHGNVTPDDEVQDTPVAPDPYRDGNNTGVWNSVPANSSATGTVVFQLPKTAGTLTFSQGIGEAPAYSIPFTAAGTTQ